MAKNYETDSRNAENKNEMNSQNSKNKASTTAPIRI